MHSLEPEFHIDDWSVDSLSGDINRGGHRNRLEPRPMAVLVYLASHVGRVVSKDELMSAVWSDTCVGDDSVWRSIYAVRKAFDVGNAGPSIVETVPKRGYRLVATIGGLDPLPDATSGTPAADVAKATGILTDRQESPAEPERRVPNGRAERHPAQLGVPTIGWPTALLLILVILILEPQAADQSRAEEATSPQAASNPSASSQVESAHATSRSAPTGRDFLARGQLSYDGQLTGQEYSAVELDRAGRLFAKAIELDPTLALAHAELASVLMLRGLQAGKNPWRSEAAVESAETAALLDPNLPEAHKALALIALYQGRLAEAERQLVEALSLRPDYDQARDGLADVLVARGRLGQALELRRQLLASDLPRPRMLSDLARVLIMLDHDTEARHYVREAIDLDPGSQQALLLLARLDLRAGDLDAAQRRLKDAISTYPDTTAFRDQLAVALQKQGDLEGARAVLEQSTRMPGGKFVSSWLSLVAVLHRQGESERIAVMLEHLEASCQGALDLGEESADLRVWLAAIYGLRGQTRVALSWLDDAIDRGFIDLEMLRFDHRLDTLRGEAAFDELVERVARRIELERSQDSAHIS